MPWQLSLCDALTTCEMRSEGKVCVCVSVRTLYSYYTSNVCTIKLDNTPGESSSLAFAPLCPAVHVRHVRQWALNKAILILSQNVLSTGHRWRCRQPEGMAMCDSYPRRTCGVHTDTTHSTYSSCQYGESCRFVSCVDPHSHTQCIHSNSIIDIGYCLLPHVHMHCGAVALQ